jgi:outer membrane protein assembly factor BamB
MHFRGSQTFILAGLFAVCSAQSADWPQWRGPNRDGHSAETGLLQEWPKDGPTLLWKTNGLGGGYSSVAVVKDRIYTLGDGEESSSLHALDSSGKHLWMAKLGRIGGGGGYPGPRCTPTVDEGRIYAMGQFGDLICVEADSGKELWRKNMKKDFTGQGGGWGYTESPLIDGEQLICTPGGREGTLVALNKKNGELIWRTKDWKDDAQYSSPIIAEIGGVRQYIQLTGVSVAGIDAKEGSVLWRAARRGSTAIIPTPIYHDNHVYVTSGYRIGCNLFKVTPGKPFTVEQVYANHNMEDHHGGVILQGDHIYGHSDSKGWICQDFKTGEVVWSTNKVGKGSITFADGHFYLRDESRGTVALIDATPDGYRERGRFVQPNRSDKNSWPHPVVANGRLYLRDQDLLLCYDLKKQ